MATFEEALRFARRVATRRGVRQRVFGRREVCMCRRFDRDEHGRRRPHDGYVGWEYYIRDAK